MNFAELAFKRIDERWITTRDYIDWANELLEAGCDAPSIWELAACRWDNPADPDQVERLFQSCLGELGLQLPGDWYEALRAYSRGICERMLGGEMPPWDCMLEMLAIADDHNAPYIHWIWIDLADDLHRGAESARYNAALDLDHSDECIRTVARQFVVLCSLPLPDKFPWVWRCQECGATSEESTFTEIKTFTCPRCGRLDAMKNMRFFTHREAFMNSVASQAQSEP